MFVGLMLSSTLVIVEKKSKAHFRVFTTPTRDEFYLWTTFLTAFTIVALQVIIILTLMQVFFVNLITANLAVNLVLLILSISIFIMIGMAIGYAMSNQQGTNMVSISVGAICLFISNMVLPLESISPYLKEIANFNPYVLASETLRQSILFNVSFEQIIPNLGILFAYTIIIAMAIILFQRVSKNSFFRNIPHIKAKRKTIIAQFTINSTVINSEKSFIEAIHKLNEEEFKLLVQKSKAAKKFVKENLNHESLSKELKKLDKKEFLNKIISKKQEIIKDIESKSKRLRKGKE
jgi:ABC-type polysaccharide/polyol phosphate export permease